MQETTAPKSGVSEFLRGIKRSAIAAAFLLAWDVALSGSYVFSILVCPFWFLVSLSKNAIQRPRSGLALVRVTIPLLTLAVARINSDFQLKVAEANAQRVVVACEPYRAANGRFPRKLDELVPRYFQSVPVARHCLGPSSVFFYYSSGTPMLVWQVVPPYYRKIYDFETRKWSYLE